MAAPVFTPLPTTPDRDASPETFSADADAFLGALPTFQTQGNSLGSYCETQAGAALGYANDSAASASLAQSSVTTYTNVATFNAVTPAANTLHILLVS
tara:strand:+ start:928 stop:1221 length:294 start_codon:yes stop_codon:yes gene_type:complete